MIDVFDVDYAEEVAVVGCVCREVSLGDCVGLKLFEQFKVDVDPGADLNPNGRQPGFGDFRRIVITATDQARDRVMPSEVRDIPGMSNAWRHAFLQAMLTQEYGYEVARLSGDLHEQGVGADQAVDSEADLLNNEVGVWIGIRAPQGASVDELETWILKAFHDGRLTCHDRSNDTLSVCGT